MGDTPAAMVAVPVGKQECPQALAASLAGGRQELAQRGVGWGSATGGLWTAVTALWQGARSGSARLGRLVLVRVTRIGHWSGEQSY